jgi:predicted ATPase
MFQVTLYGSDLTPIELGTVKIGFMGQTTATSTHERLEPIQTQLPDGFFSLGTDVDYYRALWEQCAPEIRDAYLAAMRDIVKDTVLWDAIQNEKVLSISLMRSVSLAAITGQFQRVVNGGAPLSDFDFTFSRVETEAIGGLNLSFKVEAEATPSSNVHALIGRNGVGKTTLLNDMIKAVTSAEAGKAQFLRPAPFAGWQPLEVGYFSGLVSVAFSAFDPFSPPAEQADPTKGPRYSYIGLKDQSDPAGRRLKSMDEIETEFVNALTRCLPDRAKARRWQAMIRTLESDENFARMNLLGLLDLAGPTLEETSKHLIGKMSSGHAVVLLILTRLVECVEEKTLVLIDEPESHLHPPLLSAFTRAISELLYDRNGVAIVATHSPVVLQEVPACCVWKISRVRMETETARPEIETFGENVGVLTREVFGLEVSKSGFHALLARNVAEGLAYEAITSLYKERLGLEARALLRVMTAERDRSVF